LLWQEKVGTVGYQFLCETLGLNVLAPERPAIVKPVTRVEPTDGFLAIPPDLATLVICCLDNDGRISKRRRAQFEHRVPAGVFDFIEELATVAASPAEGHSG
jgi:hypothetical protein